MKKSRKDNLKIAKKFLKISSVDTHLDEARIKKVVRAIKEGYKSASVGILETYATLLKKQIQKNKIVVEADQTLSESQLKDLKTSFEKISNQKLTAEQEQNSNILGGIKVTLDDTQWDYSIKGKIDQMKEVLNERYSS